MPNNNRCVRCGDIIPEGTQVCPVCLEEVLYPSHKRKGVSETMDVGIKSYIKEKIKLLNQLCIRLTNEQLEHILSLQTEVQVDNYAHDLICKEDE